MRKTIVMLAALSVPTFAAANSLDAAQLANAFYSQKEAVAAMYGGKPIVITGTVQKHDHNGYGDLMLLVGSDPTDTYVSLRFVKRDEAKAGALKVGTQITATCVGDFRILPSAMDCHF